MTGGNAPEVERVAIGEADSGSESEDYYIPQELGPSDAAAKRRRREWFLVIVLGIVTIVFAAVSIAQDAFRGNGGVSGAASGPLDPDAIEGAMQGMPIQPDSSFVAEEGLFTVYRGTGAAAGIVLFEVPESQMDKPFVIGATWYRGNAETFVLNMPVDQVGEETVFAIRISEVSPAAVDIYPPQLYMTLESEDSPLNVSYSEGTYTGWRGTLPFIPGQQRGGESAILINVTPWLLSGMSLVNLDYLATAKRIVSASSFNQSVRVDIEVEVGAEDEEGGGGSIQAGGIAFTLLSLPDDPMKARKADERIGYFVSSHIRLDADRALHTKLDLVNRRNLHRKNMKVDYVIHETVPLKWREVIKEGVEEWNKAFRKLGLPDVMRALLPGDKDYPNNFRVGDASYNSISWSPSLMATYALGPAVVDPRSGEMLYSHIVMTHGWIRSLLEDGRLFSGKENLRTSASKGKRQDALAGAATSAEITRSVQRLHRLMARGSKGDDEEIVRQALKAVAMHEVGHTLGLRHNFRGSANYDLDSLSDHQFVLRRGLTSSVMDYLPAIFRAKKEDHTFYYTPTLGDYDYRAIEYGYSEQLTTETSLSELAARTVNDGLHFATDEDLQTSIRDPNVGPFDVGREPMAYNLETLGMIKSLFPELKKSAEQDNIPWFDFSLDVKTLVAMGTRQLYLMTRYVGGFSVDRSRAGQGTSVPTQVVDPDKSKQALDYLLDALNPTTGLLGYETVEPYLGFFVERTGGSCSSLESVCLGQGVVEYVEFIRQQRLQLLAGLISPDYLAATSLAHGRSGGKSISAHDLLTTLSDTLVSEKIGENPVASDAASHWVELLLQIESNSDSEEIPAALAMTLSGELSRLHELVTDEYQNAKDPEKKAMYWALAYKTKKFELASDGSG